MAISLSLTACGTEGKDQKSAANASPSPMRTLDLAGLSQLPSQQIKAQKNVRVRLTGKQGKDSIDISMIMSQSNGSLDYDMTMSEPGAAASDKIHIVKLGKETYIETPPGEDPLEPGKPWAKVPANSKNPLGATFNLMGAMFSKMADPDQSMMKMAGDAQAAAKVTSVKEETLDGARTLHYAVSIDFEQMIRTMDLRKLFSTALGAFAGLEGTPGLGNKPGQAAKKLENLSDAQLAKIKAGMLKKAKGVVMNQDLWVNTQNLPVKQIMTMPSGAGKATVPLTTVYSDWGKATITAPPANQVAVLPDDFTS